MRTSRLLPVRFRPSRSTLFQLTLIASLPLLAPTTGCAPAEEAVEGEGETQVSELQQGGITYTRVTEKGQTVDVTDIDVVLPNPTVKNKNSNTGNNTRKGVAYRRPAKPKKCPNCKIDPNDYLKVFDHAENGLLGNGDMNANYSFNIRGYGQVTTTKNLAVKLEGELNTGGKILDNRFRIVGIKASATATDDPEETSGFDVELDARSFISEIFRDNTTAQNAAYRRGTGTPGEKILFGPWNQGPYGFGVNTFVGPVPVFARFEVLADEMIVWKGELSDLGFWYVGVNGYIKPFARAYARGAGGVGGSWNGIAFEAGIEGNLNLVSIGPIAGAQLRFDTTDACRSKLVGTTRGDIWLQSLSGDITAYAKGCFRIPWTRIQGCKRLQHKLYSWGGVERTWNIWNADVFNEEFQGPSCGQIM